MNLERVILSHLVYNDEFTRQTIPFLKTDYFHDSAEKEVFHLIESYVKKYNAIPSKEALFIDLSNREGINQIVFDSAKELIAELEYDAKTDKEWLTHQTEKFCQEKALYNAIRASIQIIDDKDNKHGKGQIPQLLSEALAISFDNHIGHDFLDDTADRYEFYHTKETRIPFDLEYFNKITEGGIARKTLTVILAGTGVGKSLFMCHCAASNLMDGKNVLYITMEMSEARIAERIDANLLDVPVKELKYLEREMYDKKVARVKGKTSGKLIIKEYPTASAGSANFRHLLNELKLKKNFVPDIIYIDYINICMSSRIKYGSNINSYTYIKTIAEELRGLSVEFDVPVVSATQVNRTGFTSSDVGLEDTSESFGLPATADFMFALISSEELEELNQIMVKQLKNRYSDPNTDRRFVIGVDRARMRLYNSEQNAQDLQDRPVMDSTKFMTEEMERNLPRNPFRDKMAGFK